MRKGVYLVVRTLFHWQKKLLMARNFFPIFTENNPARGTGKKIYIPDVNWLKVQFRIGQNKQIIKYFCMSQESAFSRMFQLIYSK